VRFAGETLRHGFAVPPPFAKGGFGRYYTAIFSKWQPKSALPQGFPP